MLPQPKEGSINIWNVSTVLVQETPATYFSGLMVRAPAMTVSEILLIWIRNTNNDSPETSSSETVAGMSKLSLRGENSFFFVGDAWKYKFTGVTPWPSFCFWGDKAGYIIWFFFLCMEYWGSCLWWTTLTSPFCKVWISSLSKFQNSSGFVRTLVECRIAAESVEVENYLLQVYIFEESNVW